MRYLILTLILASAISCNGKMDNRIDGKTDNKTDDKKENKTDDRQTKYTLKPYETVIPADPKMESVFGKDYKNWTPENNDIEAAEKLLYHGMEEQKRGTVNRLLGKSPDDYDRQFVGGIDANGEKIIWINCFCKSQENFFKEWKNKIVYVADGGNCYFNVKVNLTKNTYTDFIVNGNP